ncbi:hypothetical protein ALO75_200156 [Pseudomonas syringae pv. coryli]|uniref:Uncharacterized protein n=1 Tax=Pseudomonas syringae pv. coryli TaxID=317659 RepID=A0A0N8R7E1_9PSED|nr:hypothetical protein ALO75_200156 [Pseudomonas syringae pv. coryli]
METSRPGPTNSIILRSKDAFGGMATLSVVAEGQKGAVAVVGSLYVTGTRHAESEGLILRFCDTC